MCQFPVWRVFHNYFEQMFCKFLIRTRRLLKSMKSNNFLKIKSDFLFILFIAQFIENPRILNSVGVW